MNATVIDTLRFANRLKEVGFDPSHAEGMACVLGDELAERMLARRDLDEFKVVVDARFEAIDAKIDNLDAKLDSTFDGLDAKLDSTFDGLDAKFDSTFDNLDAKFDSTFDNLDAKFDSRIDNLDAKFDSRIDNLDAKFDSRIDGLDAKFHSSINSLDGKFEAKFDALDLKIESVQREVSGKFNVLACMMVLGFTVLGGLVTYTASSPRFSPSPAEASVTQDHTIERTDDSAAAPAT